ncbi:MAG: T9SS type A sorting domain-containing protein [Bacteroidia bacterium]
MKKIYLLIVLSIATITTYSQCIPDPAWNTNGISPSRAPDGVVGTNYSTVISFKTPKDTVIFYAGQNYNATIDSARVDQIRNIPLGFSWACNKSNCTWKGGDKGCALLEGKPDSNHFKHYEIKVFVRSWISIVGLSFPVERLDSSIIDFYVTGGKNSVSQFNNNPTFNVFPNPVKNILTVESIRTNSKNTEVVITDITGKILLNKHLTSNVNTIDVSELPKGLHFITIKNEEVFYSKKLLID